MPFHHHTLTPRFERLLLQALDGRTWPELAGPAKKLSDFYLAHPGAPTPWSEAFAKPAYLAYFLPLNFVRLRAVWAEVQRFLPNDSYSEIWDFGSGLGTTQWVLEETPELKPRSLFCVESEKLAIQEHERLNELFRGEWRPEFTRARRPGPKALAVFSYSFLEMTKVLPNLEAFEHLVIVEPSFRETARELMQWRARFLEMDFHPLAPCTHEEACPLLTRSKKDWCHQRIPFEAPAWWSELESHLPMTNRTLTYSYLIVSRRARDPQWQGTSRIIGDTLKENGKTRQAICRGPEREFLSWLHKFGEPPALPHGALVRGAQDLASKGGELRPELGSLAVVNDDAAER